MDVLDLVGTEGTSETNRTNFVLTVRLERYVEGGVDVTLGAVGYTATQGVDFESAYGSVHFNEDELVKTFTVEVFADQAREADEKFMVTIQDYQATTGFTLPTGTRYGNGKPWALVEINNDDEGIYTGSAGTKRVGFYHGSDPGGTLPNGTPTASGTNFQAAADFYYDDIFDVTSWEELIAALTDYVEANGRVDEVGIFDHGNIGGQQIGDAFILHVEWEELAPFLDDGTTLRLYGCYVAQGQNGLNYCNWAADDAGPEARVVASDGDVRYFADGHVEPTAPGQFVTIDGVDHGYHP